MWIIAVLALAGFWFWRSNIRRAQKFVRAVCFLGSLDRGSTVNDANAAVARLFTKHSSPEADADAIKFANDKAQRFTNGKQLPWIHEARAKGFNVDSGRGHADTAQISQGAELGKKVGLTVRNEITLPFTNASAPIPERIFLDPYVAGFAFHLTKIIGISSGALELSQEQCVIYFRSAALAIVGPKIFKEYLSLPQDSEGFTQGVRDASQYSTAMFYPGELDSSDALVSEASALAKSRAGMMGEIDKITGLGDGTEQDAEHAALIWAIKSMTLGNHYRDKYGIDV